MGKSALTDVGKGGIIVGIRGQGSGVRDQGSGIRDQGSGIRGQGVGVLSERAAQFVNQSLPPRGKALVQCDAVR